MLIKAAGTRYNNLLMALRQDLFGGD